MCPLDWVTSHYIEQMKFCLFGSQVMQSCPRSTKAHGILGSCWCLFPFTLSEMQCPSQLHYMEDQGL